jgi:bacillolysin
MAAFDRGLWERRLRYSHCCVGSNMAGQSQGRVRLYRALLASALAAAVLVQAPIAAQGNRLVSVFAVGRDLAAWTSRADTLLASGDLDIASIQDDTMMAGRIHERLAQRHEGLPVFGGQLARQIDGRGVVSLSGRLYEGVSLNVVPSIDSATAARIAERDAGEDAVAGEPVLGILPMGEGGYALAYRVVVRTELDIRVYDVNASTRAIEHWHSRLQSQAPIIGRGTGVLGDAKKVSVKPITAGFQAADPSRPAPAYTLDFRGSVTRLNSFLQTGAVFTSDVAVDSDNVWTDPAIVDAHTYQGWIYDYYYKRFGRRGLDDRNIEVIGIVHPLARADFARYTPETSALFINNALYVGDGVMIYGDGDGRVLNYLAGALDVVCHELSHGVLDYSSQLEYQDEPGALSEAFADIMGASTEFFDEPLGSGPLKADWLMGEDVTLASPGYVRSLNNPIAAGYPDHYSLRRYVGTDTDNGGVHFNSTIVSHAFYLAVAGGRNRVSGITVGGVGLANIERMEKIFYRGFVFFLGPQSDFSDARTATLQAAAELYGANSNEWTQVGQAWTAVGVN